MYSCRARSKFKKEIIWGEAGVIHVIHSIYTVLKTGYRLPTEICII